MLNPYQTGKHTNQIKAPSISGKVLTKVKTTPFHCQKRANEGN